jgi:hypothetical protein
MRILRRVCSRQRGEVSLGFTLLEIGHTIDEVVEGGVVRCSSLSINFTPVATSGHTIDEVVGGGRVR